MDSDKGFFDEKTEKTFALIECKEVVRHRCK